MSAALVEPIVRSSQVAEGRLEAVPIAASVSTIPQEDSHPLAPIFAIGALALIGAFAFVGSIVIWLWLRNSGVLAP
jgi:hypothetical protein